MKEQLKEKFDLRLAYSEIAADFYPGNVMKTIWRYLLVVIGSLLLAIGASFFLIPYDLVSGGVSGMGIVISSAFGLGTTGTNNIVTILQWGFFVLGYFLLGAKFTMKTLISTILYPTFLYIFGYVYENVPFFHLNVEDPNLACMIAGLAGGAFVGIGVGLTFSGGGSTGGVDCVGIYLARKLNVRTGLVTFLIDFIIIISNIFVAKNLLALLLGTIAAVVTATMIDKTYIPTTKSYVAMIISKNWEEINKAINSDLDRGTTLFNCYGGFTSEERVMIQVAFSYDEYDEVQKAVFRHDPKAFMTIVSASEVNGYGFRKVPSRLEREIKMEKKLKNKGYNKKESPVRQRMRIKKDQEKLNGGEQE